MTNKARTIQARYHKGMSGHYAETSGVAIPIKKATRGVHLGT